MSVLRWIAPFVVVFLAALFLVIGPRLDQAYEAEAALDRAKDEYVERKRRLANLDALRDQLREADRMLSDLTFELPDKFDADFTHVRSAARRRGLRVEEMRLGREIAREFYSQAELRIRVSGRFHDLGAFAADIARAPGSLLLWDLNLYPSPEAGRVTMEAWVLGYRYISDEEVAAQRKKAVKGAKA